MSAGVENSDGSIDNISIETDSLSVSQSQTLLLTNYVAGNASASYNVINAPSYSYYYNTTKTVTGQLVITKFDPTKAIVSGTFFFNVIANTGNTIKVTNGRFDMIY